MSKVLKKKKRLRSSQKHSIEPLYVQIVIVTSLVVVVGGSLLFAFNRSFQQQVLGSKIVSMTFFQDGELQAPVEEGSRAAEMTENTPENAQKPEIDENVQNAHQRLQETLIQNPGMSSGSSDTAGELLVKTKDNQMEVALKKEGVKVLLSYVEETVTLTAQLPDKTKEVLADSAMEQLSRRLSEDNITVASHAESQFVVKHHEIAAVTDFSLLIDANTNTLWAETPTGEKKLAVLPDQAIAKVLQDANVTRITNNSEDMSMTLTIDEGALVYELVGVREEQFLAFFTVGIQKKITVSAETGEVTVVNASLLASLLDFFSY